jgi:hypothetical protein
MYKIIIVLCLLTGMVSAQPVSISTLTTDLSYGWPQRQVPVLAKLQRSFQSFYNKVDDPPTGTGNVVLNNSPTFTNALTINSAPANTLSGTRGPLLINIQDTWHEFGLLVGTNFAAAWYPRAVTRTAFNFGFYSEGFNMYHNIPTAGSDWVVQEAGVANRLFIRGVKTSGNSAQIEFNPAQSTGLTSETFSFRIAAHTLGFAAGSRSTQRDVIIEAVTYTAASTSTYSNTYGLSVFAPIAGTNVTLPNNNAIIASGGVEIGSNGNLSIPTGSISASGNINLTTAGSKISIKEGSNASVGTATLSGGTVTINHTGVTDKSHITVTGRGATNIGILSTTRSNGVSFTITSSQPLDARVVDYIIIEGQ